MVAGAEGRIGRNAAAKIEKKDLEEKWEIRTFATEIV
jgi:hypothetical protein